MIYDVQISELAEADSRSIFEYITFNDYFASLH